jgi:repressor LexA
MLTPRQTEVLDAIYQHVVDTGVPPTVRELCARLDIVSPNGVAQHLAALRREGKIEEADDESKSRGIMPVGLRGMLRLTAQGEWRFVKSARKVCA